MGFILLFWVSYFSYEGYGKESFRRLSLVMSLARFFPSKPLTLDFSDDFLKHKSANMPRRVRR